MCEAPGVVDECMATRRKSALDMLREEVPATKNMPDDILASQLADIIMMGIRARELEDERQD
jgi:hypothetical protein